MKSLHRFLGLLAVSLLLSPAFAATPSRLVDTAWLQENLKRGDLLVIDAQGTRAHAAAHIPGAVNVDVMTYGGKDLGPADMERLIRSWGVSRDKRIVLYDQGGTYLATSVFFDLYYHGVPPEKLFVLDGGLAKWQAAGGAVTKEPTPAPAPGDFRVNVREEARVRLPEFLVASGDPAKHALVEALDPAQHFGGMKFFDRAGHIPNAIMVPTGDFYNADKTFKSPAEIRRMLDYLGITPDKQLHSHCGGGIAASVPFFAAKFVLDYPKVKLYKESQLEWLRDDRGLPFWTYDAPQLLREKSWLSGWTSPMVRAFGVSKLSLVDVRPAAAYQQSHVPSAVNVPAEVFRRHVGEPAKLAEALGAAGIDAGFEAVIVSDGGLNADSALAFLLLERLGQKRVALLADSVDDWGFAGLPLDKPSATPDPKRPRAAPPVPRIYAVETRTGVVVTDPESTRGLYPKVFLASGKALPAKLPAGKVVHVPYTDLLDAGGKPKPAKDIWNALSKAGLPRYAEIVSIADDPGEAAANYFILKLMGYPDVKVMLL